MKILFILYLLLFVNQYKANAVTIIPLIKPDTMVVITLQKNTKVNTTTQEKLGYEIWGIFGFIFGFIGFLFALITITSNPDSIWLEPFFAAVYLGHSFVFSIISALRYNLSKKKRKGIGFVLASIILVVIGFMLVI
jgi:hypothetical protein